MTSVSYANHCCELFADSLGVCTAKRMFGGFGIYHDGLMFALIADNTLYMKTDADSLSEWLRVGARPFVYEAKGKPMQLSYYTPPEEALESPALMADWARLAWAAALRGAAKKAVPKKAAKKPSQTY
jgi:DNA transformation protein